MSKLTDHGVPIMFHGEKRLLCQYSPRPLCVKNKRRLSDEESNTNEEQNGAFFTGKLRFTVTSCVASDSLRSGGKKGAHTVNIIFCNRSSWKNREGWGRKALRLAHLHPVLNYFVSIRIIYIIFSLLSHVACLCLFSLLNPLSVNCYFLRSAYKN